MEQKCQQTNKKSKKKLPKIGNPKRSKRTSKRAKLIDTQRQRDIFDDAGMHLLYNSAITDQY